MALANANDLLGSFDVAVAVVSTDGSPAGSEDQDDEGGGALPGYDEAAGLRPGVRRVSGRVLIMGEEAVRAATEAIAGQIGLAAQRIATAVDTSAVTAPLPGELGVESVEVSFGITLTGGIQALFTAKAESSAQVSITLTRRPATDG